MGEAKVKSIKKVAADAAKDIVMPMLNRRLDEIEAFCKESLMKADKRAKDIDGYLIRQVKFDIQNQMYNVRVTLDSAMEVLAEAGLNIPDFAAKIDAKKLEIDARLKAQAQEEQVRRQQEIANTAAPQTDSKPADSV